MKRKLEIQERVQYHPSMVRSVAAGIVQNSMTICAIPMTVELRATRITLAFRFFLGQTESSFATMIKKGDGLYQQKSMMHCMK